MVFQVGCGEASRQVAIAMLCLAAAVNRWNVYEQSGANLRVTGDASWETAQDRSGLGD